MQHRNSEISILPTRYWEIINSGDCTTKVCVLAHIRQHFDTKTKLVRIGIVHTAGAQYRDENVNVDVPDDPQTKFYKRHMKRTEAPSASGRTPIYDFDEWNDKHYGVAFKRSQDARKRFHDKPIEEASAANSVKYEITILGGMVLMTMILYLIVRYDSSGPDDISVTMKER